MRYKNLSVILISHLLLIGALGFVVYLYADIFIFDADASPDDGYYLFHLIITVPFPIICAALLSLFVGAKKGSKAKEIFRKTFPFICLILTIGQFSLLSFGISYILCLVISNFLFCISIILFIYDIRNGY